MLKRLLLLLLVALEVSTACTKQEPVDYREAAGAFELRVTGYMQQDLWGPHQEYATAIVYHQGQPLAIRGVADTLYPRFDWWQQLPRGRVLLGYRNLADTLAGPFAQHLYLLDTAQGRPRLQGLGYCPLSQHTQYPDRPVGTARAPTIWLTPDTLALLLAGSGGLGHAQGPPYRFVELARAATYTPVPRDPTRADGLPLDLDHIAWSPDHRQLARAYHDDDTEAAGLALVLDRHTGRQQRLAVPHATDSAGHAALYDQLRWQPAGPTYRLARRPEAATAHHPPAKPRPPRKHPAKH